MCKLLRADFARLFKSKIFWLGNIFMLCLAIFSLWTRWYEIKTYPDVAYARPDGLLMTGAFYISIVISVLIGSFVGTDYKNGTIRNKLAVGHSRIAIYFTNLIVCTIASFIMHIVWLVLAIVGGLIFIGQFEMSTGNVVIITFISFFTIASFSSIFLFVCILIPSKSTGSVVAIILAIVLLMAGSMIYYRLAEKEYIEVYDYSIIDKEDPSNQIESKVVKNPKYIDGIKRKICEFLNDVLPNNQIFQLSNGGSKGLLGDEGEIPKHISLLPIYSLSLIIVMTTIGIVIFCKKDLK